MKGNDNEKKWPECPYLKAAGVKWTGCEPALFDFDLYTPDGRECRTCPDYDRNYEEILRRSVAEAEKNPDGNLAAIREDLKRDGGKLVDFGGDGMRGLLVSASATIEDYYWLWLDKDRKLQATSCVGSYEVLCSVPPELSVLDWIVRNDRKSLVQLTERAVRLLKRDVLIAPLYV